MDTSLWPIVLTGVFTLVGSLGGIGVGLVGADRTAIDPERDFARRIGQFGFGPATYVHAEVREVLLPQQVAVLSMQRALNFLILELRLCSKHFNEVFVCQNNHVASRPG